MTKILTRNNNHRIIIAGNTLVVQSWHTGEWWNTLTVLISEITTEDV